MIQIENLGYHYPNGTKVLNNLSITIRDGEFVAIIGQNGAGKTTLLKHFNGLLKPTTGNVIVNEKDISKTKTSILAKSIGFLFQNPDYQIFCSTVKEEIAFGLKNIGIVKDEIERQVAEAAQKVGILPFLEANPFSLSKGQRQRVAFASVLAMGSDIMVLDEPTTGQDYKEGLEIMEMVRQLNREGKTIIVVTHDMELVSKYVDRVIILKDGSVLEDGKTEQVLSKTESLVLSHLKPPQIYELAKMFYKYGIFKKSYSVEDMFEEILTYVEGEKNACIS
jgi:energy-coupling factor transport system ATP-binding protein